MRVLGPFQIRWACLEQWFSALIAYYNHLGVFKTQPMPGQIIQSLWEWDLGKGIFKLSRWLKICLSSNTGQAGRMEGPAWVLGEAWGR